MNFVVPDFYPAAAEIFVAVMALVIMLASTFARSIARSLSYYATQFTLIAAAFVTIFTMEGEPVYTFSNLFISDLMGDFLKLMIYFSTAIALLYGRAYLADRKIAESVENYQEALDLYRELGRKDEEVSVLSQLGTMAMEVGQVRDAMVLYAVALEVVPGGAQRVAVDQALGARVVEAGGGVGVGESGEGLVHGCGRTRSGAEF